MYKREKKTTIGPSVTTTALNTVRQLPSVLFQQPAIGVIFACHIVHNFGSYMLSNFGLVYFRDGLGLSATQGAAMLSGCNVVAAIFNLLSKRWAVLAQAHGLTLIGVRRLFTCGPLLLGAACFFILGAARPTPMLAAAAITAIACAHTLFSSGYVANYIDVSGQCSL